MSGNTPQRAVPTRLPVPTHWLCLVLAALTTLQGCVAYAPKPVHEVPFLQRAQTQRDGDVQVTVAVPSREESKEIFGVSTYEKGIQPVWVQIENQGTVPYLLLKAGLDPNYYPPAEAAYANHYSTTGRVLSYGALSIVLLPLLLPGIIGTWSAISANKAMDTDFQEKGLSEVLIAPGQSAAGFVFTSVDPGTKSVHVPLYGPEDTKRFDFVVPIPGIRRDYERVDFAALYAAQEIVSVDEEGLRRALENLPCCTTNERGSAAGDPLNLILVGELEEVLQALTQAYWDETETIYAGSAWRTAKSFLFGSAYRVSPVSNLYAFGRKQDAAFQKARDTIHQRHHFRLWYTPIRFQGKPIWVGAATRDIGVRFTLKTWNLTTHIIDPDVDDARDYVAEDLIEAANRVSAVGFVGGVGITPPSSPRTTLTGGPWYSEDGLRIVIFLSDHPVDRPRALDWAVSRRWQLR